MKIVDQTPFYKENGELGIIDRAKAILQYGVGWFKQVEAEKSIIAVLGRTLDKNYTLLHNIIPPGLDARIPLILVGPTGVYVLCVTTLLGTFRARGDQWGTISGNAFKPSNPNLLTRTERMARAILVFLQRQGYADLTNVEAVLLCADPSTNVDSMRPIIRAVMRDALERFGVSVMQARILLNPESAYDVVNRLLTPPAPPPTKPEEPSNEDATTASEQAENPSDPAFALSGAGVAGASVQPVELALPPYPAGKPTRRPSALTSRQMLFLAGMFIVWVLIVLVFIVLSVRNANPQLFILK